MKQGAWIPTNRVRKAFIDSDTTRCEGEWKHERSPFHQQPTSQYPE
jgi:hypothetical protein